MSTEGAVFVGRSSDMVALVGIIRDPHRKDGPGSLHSEITSPVALWGLLDR